MINDHIPLIINKWVEVLYHSLDPYRGVVATLALKNIISKIQTKM